MLIFSTLLLGIRKSEGNFALPLRPLCLLESPQQGDSNTHPRHMILWILSENEDVNVSAFLKLCWKSLSRIMSANRFVCQSLADDVCDISFCRLISKAGCLIIKWSMASANTEHANTHVIQRYRGLIGSIMIL